MHERRNFHTLDEINRKLDEIRRGAKVMSIEEIERILSETPPEKLEKAMSIFARI